jgi:hypothetical protein
MRDGARFLVSTVSADRRARVLVFDAATGASKPLPVHAEPIVDLSFAPHGGEMFFAAGDPQPEYWTLSGFLAP